ncbi:unnamed protein product, partial [Rotaria sordida]
FIQNCVAYTATHYNPTAIGLWTKHAEDYEKKTFVNNVRLVEQLDEYCNEDDRDNVANIAIIQLQDLLGLDDTGRMNDPSLSSDAGSDSR